MEQLLGFNLQHILQTIGYIGIFAIAAAESGLFIGFFLPGDSMLFTAGFLASQGYFSFHPLWIIIAIGAIFGDSIGYAFGRHIGPKIFTREESLFFRKSHITRTQWYFERFGGMTIILARFIAVVRTFAPILAGVGRMEYRKFLSYNIAGGILWSLALTGLGYFLGSTIPNIDHYLLPIILIIIALSVTPVVINLIRNKEIWDEVTSYIRKQK